jgi:prophage regulatory protein
MSEQTFISTKEAQRRTSLSRTTIFLLQRQGRFPQPVRLSPSKNAYLEAEISAWIADRVAERDAA